MFEVYQVEAASRFLATVLLAFLHSRISSHKSAGSKLLAKSLVVLDERAGNAKFDRASLPGHSAALRGSANVPATFHAKVNEWALDQDLKHGSSQILIEVSAVDRDFSLTWHEPDASDRALSATGSVIALRSCHLIC